ncbi:MAG: TIGR04219 family outer membrane beta-barrel protein [Psychromonas sp.]|nr:TIGR04219 family outer membrane beta-barrel protein [Psychromonas sp.]
MKKILLATLITSASFSASADMIIGGDVELNLWQQKYTLDNHGNGDDTTYTFEGSIEHMIPLIPNVKYAQSSVDGNNLEYTKRDFTLYYELLDNDMLSVDAGVGLTNLKNGKINGVEFNGDIPHVYGAAEVGVVGTPIFLFAKGTGIAYHDNHMLDVSVGAQYSIPMVAFDLELQAGYRSQQFKLSGFDDLSVKIDSQTDGFFAGVNIDF